jgi:hypothetical protein
MSKSTFGAMAGPKAKGEAPRIGVGMLGYAFMGKAHSNAYKTQPYMMYPPVAIPDLVAICGRDAKAVQEAQKRYGYRKHYTDWKKMLDDKEVQLFDNGGPNDAHAEPSIAAAKAGKHVFCEKPLARTAEEAKTMLNAVKKAKVKHQAAFNYRFVPAVRQAYELIKSGKLGRIYHYRAVYLQEWIMPQYETPLIWRLQKKLSGSGALGDLGAHIIDLGRHLIGEIESVSALTRTFIEHRARLDGKGTGNRDPGGDALRGRAQEPQPVRDQRREGHDRLRPRAAQRARGLLGRRGTEGDEGLPPRVGHGGVPSVHLELVAPRPHHRLGARDGARGEPSAGLHRERQGRGPAGRGLRGRLPVRGHLRCDPGVGALEEAGEVQVLE